MPETNDVISHLYYDLNDKIDSLDQRLDAIDVEAATEPKVYVALLTQTGTDAPVATVLKNTLGDTVVWSYVDVGIYLGTLVGAFPDNKTVGLDGDVVHFYRTNIYNNLTGNENRGYYIKKQDQDGFQVYTFSAADVTSNDILFQAPIRIEVYP